jgi:hypothetical protein
LHCLASLFNPSCFNSTIKHSNSTNIFFTASSYELAIEQWGAGHQWKLLGYHFLYLSVFFGVAVELQQLGSFLDKFTRQKNPEKFSCLK